MKTKSPSRFALIHSRLLLGLVLGYALSPALSAAPPPASSPGPENPHIVVGYSSKNDVSPALRDMPVLWPPMASKPGHEAQIREANLNPRLPLPYHVDVPDPIIEHGVLGLLVPDAMPPTILNFDGMTNNCGCAPPDTNGAVGTTQFVEGDNVSFQVFNKFTGASVFGPALIQSLWAGFGGPCETEGDGAPTVLYDKIANRWLISEIVGARTDECIAVSTTPDATGTYNRYGFHLGSNFFDYPHLGTWMDGYYMSMDVFNAAATTFLGPQAFAFDRAKMLAGMPATYVTPGITPSDGGFLCSDFDGTYFPPTGTGNPFVTFPGSNYEVKIFHADFANPDNTTFTLLATLPAAGFTRICPANINCVPQLGSTANLDAIGDRLMFRLAYRKFADGHDSVTGNYTVSANSVAGVRWFEIRNITTAPAVFQESTYQPDTTYRWTGSAAMDAMGDLVIGFSASDATINPQIRYAGRLVTDPVNTLAQGEAHLFDGTGSQIGNGNRWGNYSDLTVDPVDDCTFWYTQEYFGANGSAWRTRIGNFKFAQCVSVPHAAIITSSSSLSTESCTPGNNVIDPNETVTVSFCVQNAGSVPTTNLVGTLQNTGGVTNASGPQTYGAMAPGATGCQPFTFTAANLGCASALTATIHFQDGTTDLGNITYTFRLGVLGATATPYSENFDAVTAPALPSGWTTTASGVEVPWVTSTTTPDSAPNDAFVSEPNNVGDTELVSPNIAVPAGATFQLAFKNLYNLQSDRDGLVLEISINGGAFADIVSAGGVFGAGGYNSTISTGFMSPIAGRLAWSGLSGGISTAPAYITSTVNLPDSVNGQNIRLKWRVATDNGLIAGGTPGVRIDGISLLATNYTCCSNGPTPSPTAFPTPTPTPTASPTPPTASLLNLSTRVLVQTGNNVEIGGFIITGTGPRHVLLRGIGPSLTTIPDALPDPVLELRDSSGALIRSNDNWRSDQEAEIIATGLPPSNNLESAIVADLDPGAYTAILSGNGGVVGIGLVELYDLSMNQNSQLRNISTRGFVGTGNDIMIGGFIVGAGDNIPVVIRGLGPSLAGSGIPNVLADPTLELRDSNGDLIDMNDNCGSGGPPSQTLRIKRSPIPGNCPGPFPVNPLEACMCDSLPFGAYTALLSGVNNGTGVALLEVYANPASGLTPTPTPGGGTPTPTPAPTATPTPGTCVENFDGLTAPELPAGWVASNPIPGDGVLWVTSNVDPDTPPNGAFIPDQDGISDKVLDRQNVTINSASAMLTFRNNYNTEFSDGTFWDGGMLEISTPSISGGDFLDFTDARVGASCLSGCYTGVIIGPPSSPVAGRMAWAGDSGGYIDTIINLGPNLTGQTITLRWRFVSDEAVNAPGWHVDNLSIIGASCP